MIDAWYGSAVAIDWGHRKPGLLAQWAVAGHAQRTGPVPGYLLATFAGHVEVRQVVVGQPAGGLSN